MVWFKDWFNTPYYHILYKGRNFSEAQNFISLLVKNLELPKNSRIIDLACGKGRHSVYLNHLGFNVLGLDLSEENIAHNKTSENETLRFKVHDMRDVIENESANAVFNLFTSFGYFDEEEEDKMVFSAVHSVLEEGGFFVLDFLNETKVRQTLVPESVEQHDGIDFRISKKIEQSFVKKDIRFQHLGQAFHFYEKVKLHTVEEIEKMATESGFVKIKMFGDYLLNEFDKEQSPRCINVFKKK